MSKKPKTVPLSPLSPYRVGVRFLVLPADASQEVSVCRAAVARLEGDGAWLELVEHSDHFPPQEEVFLVEFRGRAVMTHRSRILRREGGQAWVDAPSLSRREESRLAPFTGRQDFRVEANIAVLILLKDELEKSMPRSGTLSDMSRGGMGLVVPPGDIYVRGQRVEVQVVSWNYPVSVETTVNRVWMDGDIKRVALLFPPDMSVEQRELVSAFVLGVQRREALGRSLPAPLEESP